MKVDQLITQFYHPFMDDYGNIINPIENCISPETFSSRVYFYVSDLSIITGN